MEILIGLNLLIIAIALIASVKFAALAMKKGYLPARAKKYPLLLGGGALFFNILGQTLFSFASRDMLALLIMCWGGFVVLAFVAILLKAYRNMKAAPDQNKPA